MIDNAKSTPERCCGTCEHWTSRRAAQLSTCRFHVLEVGSPGGCIEDRSVKTFFTDVCAEFQDRHSGPKHAINTWPWEQAQIAKEGVFDEVCARHAITGE